MRYFLSLICDDGMQDSSNIYRMVIGAAQSSSREDMVFRSRFCKDCPEKANASKGISTIDETPASLRDEYSRSLHLWMSCQRRAPVLCLFTIDAS